MPKRDQVLTTFSFVLVREREWTPLNQSTGDINGVRQLDLVNIVQSLLAMESKAKLEQLLYSTNHKHGTVGTPPILY